MESITGKSRFLRAVRYLPFFSAVMVGLSSCAQQEAPKETFTIHFGTDTRIAVGNPGDVIIAAADGTVDHIASSANSEWIIIYHGRDDDGLHMRTGYAHHREVLVKEGDVVKRGQAIGIVGGRKNQPLLFTVAKAPANLSGPSSAWINQNVHEYWIGGLGKVECFEPGTIYPENLTMRLTWPLECRSGESLTGTGSTLEHPNLNSARHKRMFESYLDYFEGLQGFKVLVMTSAGAWAWRSRTKYENAMADSMTACAEVASRGGCRLFAVGDTIVWDMTRDEQEKVIAKYKATRMPASVDTTAPMGSSALASFENYERVVDDWRFKVFVLSESGNWHYRTRPTYEEALKDAMDTCDEHATRRGFCRLFAVGNTVVWDMSDQERDSVIEAYRDKNN